MVPFLFRYLKDPLSLDYQFVISQPLLPQTDISDGRGLIIRVSLELYTYQD